jgi:hypothetical protein
MNRQERRNAARRHLDTAYNTKENVIKLNAGTTLEHELAKFLLCWELLQTSQTFVTEAIFTNGARADIFVLDTCEAWEVLKSETAERFDNKDYPVPKRAFKAAEVIEQWMRNTKQE